MATLLSVLFAFSRSTSLPVRSTQYTVTINDTTWDFSGAPFAQNVYTVTTIHPFDANAVFYVRVFDFLQPNDIPSDYSGVNSTIHRNVMRCNNQTKVCRNVASIYDFYWTTQHDDNLSLGIIYEANGDPNWVSTGQYVDYAVSFEFFCSTTQSVAWRWDDTAADERLVGRIFDPTACGKPAAAPATPTPNPTARCFVRFRKDEQPEQGLIADLNALNNGQFGYTSVILDSADLYSATPPILFWQPCDIIAQCPWGATCDAPNSSAWLCQYDNSGLGRLTICQAYGTIKNGTTFTLNGIGEDFTQGFNYEFVPQNGRTSKIVAQCLPSYPEGHIDIDVLSSRKNGDTALLYVSATEFCQREYPIPITNDTCGLSLTQTGPFNNGSWAVDFNLSHYATDPATGKVWNHTLQRVRPFPDSYDIVYSPCDNVLCPSGYDCEGDPAANLYVCERNDSNPFKFCTAYGIHTRPIIIDFAQEDMFQGITVEYFGSGTHSATVIWNCDNDTAPGDIRWGPFLAMAGTEIGFNVFAKEACAQGSGPTPSPPPRPIPARPRAPRNPTPTPLLYPNPIRILENDTHYILVDLNQLQLQGSGFDFYYHDTLIRGKWGEIWSRWSPWEPVPRPYGNWSTNVSAFGNYSNLWMCWWDEDLVQYCHPAAQRHVPGYAIRNTHAGDLDSPVSIIYPGAWNTNLEIISYCNYFGQRTLDLKDSTFVVYQDSLNGPEFTFNVTSSYTCPRQFTDWFFPNVSRSPAPSGAGQDRWIQATVGEGDNVTHVGLDLAKIESQNDTVTIGDFGQWGDALHKAQIYYSPWERIGCPDSRNCSQFVSDEANVWKCVNPGYTHCYPVGDRVYGVTLDVLDSVSINGVPPVRARYAGGADNWSAEFIYVCNPDLDPGTMAFSAWGNETGWPPVLAIWIHTAETCKELEWGNLSGGAVFLLIVFTAALFYLGIGTLIVYIASSSIAIPNEGFWLGVWDSFYTAVLFIFTCGRAAPSGPIYDRV